MFRFILLFIFVLNIIISPVILDDIGASEITIAGPGYCFNGIAGLIRDKISDLKKGDKLCIMVDDETKDLVSSVIAMEGYTSVSKTSRKNMLCYLLEVN